MKDAFSWWAFVYFWGPKIAHFVHSVSHPSGNVFHLRITHYALWFLHALPTQQTAAYVRTGKEVLQHLFYTNTGANYHANFTAQVVKVSIIVAAFVVDFLRFLCTATLTASMLYQLQTCGACLQIVLGKGIHCIPKWAQKGLHFYNTFCYWKKKQYCLQDVLHSKSSLICHLLHTRRKWPKSFLMLLAHGTCAN